MKKTLAGIVLFGISIAASYGAVSITGTAISGLDASDVGKTAVLYIDSTDAGFNSLIGSVTEIPSSFVEGFSGFVTGGIFGNAFSIDPPASIDETVYGGDDFGVLLFDTATSYRIYTNVAWLVPTSGTLSLTGDDTASGASPLGSGSVVPEPSTFSLLAGCFGLAWVMVRRRS